MNMPYWLLRLLPMWEYICPKCRKEVKANSHECPYCGEKYPLTLKVPPSFLKDPKKLEAYVHKHVFPRISDFERNYLTKYFTQIFADGFESGTILTTDVPAGAWDDINIDAGATLTVVSTNPHHNTYCLLATNDGITSVWESVRAEKWFGALGIAYGRWYVNLTVMPPINSNVFLGGLFKSGSYCLMPTIRRGGGGDPLWCLRSTENGVNVSTDGAGTSVPAINTWFCIELCRDVTNGHQILYVNGLQEASQDRAITGNTDHSYVGITGASGTATAYNVRVDCVVLADAYIGPETTMPKGTIAIHAKLAGII